MGTTVLTYHGILQLNLHTEMFVPLDIPTPNISPNIFADLRLKILWENASSVKTVNTSRPMAENIMVGWGLDRR